LGVTRENGPAWSAWVLYNQLQNRLNTKFTTAFTALKAKVNADGHQRVTYLAAGPWEINCRQRDGRVTEGMSAFLYQLTTEGGASYGCNKFCPPDQDDERAQDQPRVSRPVKKGKQRATQEGEEPAIQEPGDPGQPVREIPGVPADAPTGP